MRTFSRDIWEDAQAAWAEGEFSDEWRELRHVMAMQGCIYPPNGTAYDSWEDDQPSQRAILIRALRETPELLRRCTRKATSWSQVIERLLAARDTWREDLDRLEADRDEQAAFDPSPREASVALGRVFERVADSLGYVRRDAP